MRIFYELVESPDDGGWYAEVFSADDVSHILYETNVFTMRCRCIGDIMKHYPTAELLTEFPAEVE